MQGQHGEQSEQVAQMVVAVPEVALETAHISPYSSVLKVSLSMAHQRRAPRMTILTVSRPS
ncbi:MAG: hypothetical protein OXD29_09500, partial [Roseovarius sp.]|nr:hypothetical protein [Roseovarius sp.]